jgi:RNA polymerase sigma factor (sigma-70 family)
VALAADVNPEVRAEVRRLSVQQRAVVFLFFWEDMSEQTIAELLNVSTGTVHKNLSRAKARLRKALQ